MVTPPTDQVVEPLQQVPYSATTNESITGIEDISASGSFDLLTLVFTLLILLLYLPALVTGITL